MAPHLIRKVYSRDGSLLEEWDNSSSKVMSEYVALTMVQMMRGVTAPGGTAPGASAAGQPLAGKTGTVNDHTDVWFIGYTPTYATGVWMGNPLKKENLGGNMTGGHGALPYFNAFMNPFMKGKPRESFPSPPPIPSDIRSLMERNKREELEKLEKADQAAIRSGALADANAEKTGETAPETGGAGDTSGEKPQVNIEPSKPKVQEPEQPKTPVKEPERKTEPPAQPEGGKRKGKKGDG
jgi:penicillin-binding protein 1A